MTTGTTSLLGLALPVTGENPGTWGTLVNTSITNLVDSAIAGTTTLSSDADVTLTSTTLVDNQARQPVILWTAGGTVTRNITVPAQSKTYIVINKTSSTQSIVLRGAGPTTGVTIVAGEKALCVWNGLDFVKVNAPTAKSLTFATTGGDTSGTTFDGSVAHTISPVTIGALSTNGGTVYNYLNVTGNLTVTTGNYLRLYTSGDTDYASMRYQDGSTTLAAPSGTLMKWNYPGYVTTPLNCAFLVTLSSSPTNVTGNSFSNYSPVFNNVVFDRASNFNTSTYRFTAPVTGVYLFTVGLAVTNLSGSGSTILNARINTNSQTYAVCNRSATSSGFAYTEQIIGSVHAQMTANDEAYVTMYGASGTSSQAGIAAGTAYGTWFSGQLVG
jgi:hypothetical protein